MNPIRNIQQQQQRRWQQTSLPPKPAMTSNPTLAAFQVVGKQVRVTMKYTALTAISLALATAITWQSYHLYIEHYCEPTPTELSYRARNLLHGAYVREHVSPDYAVAAKYVRQVLALALDDPALDESTSEIIHQLRLRLADNENRAGHVLEAITEYTRAYKFRPSVFVAKKLGDLYLRIGDQQQAERFLTWAFKNVQDEQQQEDQELRITTLCSLASLYATQRHYELALPLLLQALKSMPQDDWVCHKGIIQNQLCEVMYGMGKTEEALGWAQASLESCSQKEDQDCRECGGVVSNNLGRLLEIKGDFDKALTHYKQAVSYATASNDSMGQEHYEMNVQRLNEQLSQKEHQGATTLSAVTSAIEPSPKPLKKDDAAASAWLGGLFGKK
ncbi:hypothetical protein BDB00DRAFT_766921 [Zychaea mexicana]|uniref:uncharacterized protein n=1 Tax=Zychaea mexicana TaxID=64656 RepID=UPI0022FE8E07|nr:uncharacterized protein BDB00DRAFT_766921 [Zychaea mexicana]KAI9491506.1 hypothetical protein BDB00DRAFT_766921 [Zychaea mexicana]